MAHILKNIKLSVDLDDLYGSPIALSDYYKKIETSSSSQIAEQFYSI